MKLFILLACLAGALAFSIDDFDLNNIVPIYETVEWQKEHPDWSRQYAASRASRSSIDEGRNSRIWGGSEASQGQLPYKVGILILLSRQAFCGGSIISNNFVLSAAQCFPGDPNAVVEIGSVDRNTVTQFINAAQKILHPAFDASTSDNDIAIVRLVIPVTFNNNVRSIRLPNRRQVGSTFENQLAQISGWGTTVVYPMNVYPMQHSPTGGGESSPIRFKRVAHAWVISQAACRVRFPNSSSDRTLCIDGTNAQICGGDFGGPMSIIDPDGITTQVGIGSFISPLGCTREWPGGFTRVAAYLDWIAQNSDVRILETWE